MLAVPVYTTDGQRVGQMEVDPELLGGRVRPTLLKQAVVAYLDHQRQFSARTKSRSMVAGSTRKLYRQKGTGRARMGNIRTCVRRGGGRAFAKQAPFAHKTMPRGMRSLAWRNAVLAKLKTEDVLIVDGLAMSAPKTKALAGTLKKIGVDRGCVLATNGVERALHLSGRNIPKTEVRPMLELNAYEILRRRKLVFTKPAFEAFLTRVSAGA
ncbi:MAG: 50S ribosomal protein L4 [Phycisphaerae bacterium]|nr:50S ribosomal protein L4 [Phycisphaerae bacterium]